VSPPTPADTLRQVTFNRRVIQDFCPLAESLECHLAEIYWSVMGLQPFVSNDVPYLVNNSGRASTDAANLLFENCLECDAGSGPIRVLELGAGTGLFARFLLDAFRLRCLAEGRDFYERVIYTVTDHSPRTVSQWRERRVFEAHVGHVHPAVCDALTLEVQQSEQFDAPSGFRAIIANYLLDVLPAAIVRLVDDRVEQLHVRTYLASDKLYAGAAPSVEQVKSMIGSDDPVQRARLIDLVSMLEFETKYVPISDRPPPYLDCLRSLAEPPKRMVLNYGALQCVDRCITRLSEDGFMLINDYGPQKIDEIDDHASAQRFGICLATGINFPLLDRHLESTGLTFCQPDSDPGRQINSRLVSRRHLPMTAGAFDRTYSKEAQSGGREPILAAVKHVNAGRYEEALAEYAIAMERAPLDWHLIGEIAEFVGLRLQNYDIGIQLCREALELNPTLSSWLWNIYGDCQYCLDEFVEAHRAYEEARRIDPADARTHLNLVFTHQIAGRFEEALQSVASGLMHDRIGVYRSQLLEKQHEIVHTLSRRWIAEQERIVARMRVFS
jgi:SAM-dependent methyltransferase